LDELEQLLKGVAMMKELTPRTRDYLVSFGECMSTRIFAAYLNKLGKKARQVCQIFEYVLLYTPYNLLFIIVIGFELKV
jgi:aspartokinase